MIDKFSGEFRFLSNFYPVQIEFGLIAYPSVEHAYQAAKTSDVDERKRISGLKTAGEAKKAGRTLELRKDWEECKDQIMYKLNYLKFRQPEFKKLLLSTGNHKLVEGNHWGDTYWGVCNGEGQNKLGKILMQLREELRNGCCNFRVGVQLLGSGNAAVLLADYEDMNWCTDVVNTGIGRYKTRKEAVDEAKSWAKAEQISLEV